MPSSPICTAIPGLVGTPSSSTQVGNSNPAGKVARARLCPDYGEVLGWLGQLRAPVRMTGAYIGSWIKSSTRRLR